MDKTTCAQPFTAKEQALIELTERYVRQTLEKDSTGHDWWHIYRVRNNARLIVRDINDIKDVNDPKKDEKNKCDGFVVELAALLHDIADWKFHAGDPSVGGKTARVWLDKQELSDESINHVCDIINTSSYKGAFVSDKMATLEGMIVQDADRLDAVGAIGIARAFAYGGHFNRPLYEPDVKPTLHASFEEYKNSKGHTVNHFYEKLLLLKDRMHTEAARKIAQERHAFMESYLEQFYGEWEGRM